MKSTGEELAVGDVEAGTDHRRNVEVAPGLRQVPGRGDVGRGRLGDVERQLAAAQQRRWCRSSPVRERRDRAGRGHGRDDAGIRSLDPRAGVPISVSGVSADTENEPPNGAAHGVADLRDADMARLADIAAKVERLGVGVRVGEVRGRLAGEEPAQRAVGIAQARDQIVD